MATPTSIPLAQLILPSDADEQTWAPQLTAFVTQTPVGHADYSTSCGAETVSKACESIVGILKKAGAGTLDWSTESTTDILSATKILMYERSDATSSIFSGDAIDALISVCERTSNSDAIAVFEEGLKCVNNCLFNNKEPLTALAAKPDTLDRLLVSVSKRSDVTSDHLARVCRILLFFFTVPGLGKVAAEVAMRHDVRFLRFLVNQMSMVVQELLPKEGSPWIELRSDSLDTPNTHLLVDGLKLLYATAVIDESSVKQLEKGDEERLTADPGIVELIGQLSLDKRVPESARLGFLLAHVTMATVADDIGDTSNTDAVPTKAALQERLEGIQRQAFNLLMYATKVKAYDEFLEYSGVLARLVHHISTRVDKVLTLDEHGRADVVYDAFVVVGPVIIACNEAIKRCDAARRTAFKLVFSEEIPIPNLAGMSDEDIKEAAEKQHIIGVTPAHVLGGKLSKFLTIVDTNLKRYTGEFLFNLCGDQGTFIKRVGYGPGAHMVAIRAGTIGGIMAQHEREREERDAKRVVDADADAVAVEVIEEEEEEEEDVAAADKK